MNCRTRIRASRDAKTAVAAPIVLMSIALATASVEAQPPAAGAEERPLTAQDAAPVDITGHWVSLITDDWVYRMITPEKGDYSYLPLNGEGRRVADTWDPARDEAAGEECKGYAAPAIMRLPSRVHVTWQDENTLQLDVDTGMQTRLFRFAAGEPQGAPSWQGWSAAEWEYSGDASRRRGFYQLSGSLGDVETFGSLKVDTTNLRPGYLRKNGVPFSADTIMTEYYNLIVEDDGNEYLVIQTFVKDPQYLSEHFVRTMQFKREPNGSKRAPVECSAR